MQSFTETPDRFPQRHHSYGVTVESQKPVPKRTMKSPMQAGKYWLPPLSTSAYVNSRESAHTLPVTVIDQLYVTLRHAEAPGFGVTGERQDCSVPLGIQCDDWIIVQPDLHFQKQIFCQSCQFHPLSPRFSI
jgi:hypothetical protein